MTACLPNESIFLLLMLCIYTHCNLPYKPQRRERESERARESEREPARVRETGRERESQRKAHTDKALLPDSRQPSFPIQQNTTRLMQQQVQRRQAEAAPKRCTDGAEQDCWQISTSVPAGSTFLIYVTGCWNALFQTVRVIIINTFLERISAKRQNVSAILLCNLIALTHAGKV